MYRAREGKNTDEYGHGKSYTGEQTHAQYMHPIGTKRQRTYFQFAAQIGGEKNTNRLAYQQA